MDDEDLISLFAPRELSDENFFFCDLRIITQKTHLTQAELAIESEVQFEYSFAGEYTFISKLALQYPICSTCPVTRRILFSIGMVILPWYWMGFGCEKILVNNELCESCGISDVQYTLRFWEKFYMNVLLEFFYVNMKDYSISILSEALPVGVLKHNIGNSDLTERSTSVLKVPIDSSPNGYPNEYPMSCENKSILVPLGGGKDSLVVWQFVRSQGKIPVMMYVADGYNEYQTSWRLQEIIRITTDPSLPQTQNENRCYISKKDSADSESQIVSTENMQCSSLTSCHNDDTTLLTDTKFQRFHLVRHEFDHNRIRQCSSSCLRRCAHPWAALVMFDALLVAHTHNISEVSLGYERSADEGNGVYAFNGKEVNHQFDKSSDFVGEANVYIQKICYDTPNVVLVSDKIPSVVRDPISSPTADICNSTMISDATDESMALNTASLGLEDKKISMIDQSVVMIDNTKCASACSASSVKIGSLLSRVWELEITRIFCTEPALKLLHSVFLSCNEPVNDTMWCCKCEKCAFVYLLLSAWLPPAEVWPIFHGHNLFKDTVALTPQDTVVVTKASNNEEKQLVDETNSRIGKVFRALLGLGGMSKPFECVGTACEAKAALHLTLIQYATAYGKPSNIMIPHDSSGHAVINMSQCGSVTQPIAVTLLVGQGFGECPLLLYQLCNEVRIPCVEALPVAIAVATGDSNILGDDDISNSCNSDHMISKSSEISGLQISVTIMSPTEVFQYWNIIEL